MLPANQGKSPKCTTYSKLTQGFHRKLLPSTLCVYLASACYCSFTYTKLSQGFHRNARSKPKKHVDANPPKLTILTSKTKVFHERFLAFGNCFLILSCYFFGYLTPGKRPEKSFQNQKSTSLNIVSYTKIPSSMLHQASLKIFIATSMKTYFQHNSKKKKLACQCRPIPSQSQKTRTYRSHIKSAQRLSWAMVVNLSGLWGLPLVGHPTMHSWPAQRPCLWGSQRWVREPKQVARGGFWRKVSFCGVWWMFCVMCFLRSCSHDCCFAGCFSLMVFFSIGFVMRTITL